MIIFIFLNSFTFLKFFLINYKNYTKFIRNLQKYTLKILMGCVTTKEKTKNKK